MFSVPDHSRSAELNPHFSTMPSATTKDDGTHDHVVDPALYYPAFSYGYYSPGIESPGEWDDHHRMHGVDGTDVAYTGAQTDNLPYVYYTPSYGYGESPYNPYNPYIPGALLGLDGAYLGAQPYYTVSTYQNSASSPSHYTASAVNKNMGVGGKHNLSSSSKSFPQNHSRSVPNQPHSMSRMPEGSRVISGSSKLPLGHKASASGSGSVSHGAQSLVPQSANGSYSRRVTDNLSHGKILSQHNQLKVSVPVSGGFSGFSSSTNRRIPTDDSWHKFYYRRPFTDGTQSPELLGEQNRGPRTERTKNQLLVKAYTTKAGEVNSAGNIVISADQYNKDDFPVDYIHAKFFVIKSYSEDDVHKSVKYNIWSSTPNGNKKLNIAYEDAQRIAAGKPGACPIFLFFSVNASGQFCGVAEMVGPVDFSNDMDFWQQDKWSGSFPVKWHIIKDTPNSNFRHIILENNEYKPVTNSRDTQEIMYKPGIEMLKIFKSYVPKTSLLDDFMYYEQRQKIMHDERARSLSRINAVSSVPSGKLRAPVDLPVDVVGMTGNAMSTSGKMMGSATEHIGLKDDGVRPITMVSKGSGGEENGGDGSSGGVSDLKISSLTINSEPPVKNSESVDQKTVVGTYGDTSTTLAAKGSKRVDNGGGKDGGVSSLAIGSLTVDSELTIKNSELVDNKSPWTGSPSVMGTAGSVDTVTVGSLPVKVNGFSSPSGLLTVGTIPLDPRAMQQKETSLPSKESSAE